MVRKVLTPCQLTRTLATHAQCLPPQQLLLLEAVSRACHQPTHRPRNPMTTLEPTVPSPCKALTKLQTRALKIDRSTGRAATLRARWARPRQVDRLSLACLESQTKSPPMGTQVKLATTSARAVPRTRPITNTRPNTPTTAALTTMETTSTTTVLSRFHPSNLNILISLPRWVALVATRALRGDLPQGVLLHQRHTTSLATARRHVVRSSPACTML